MKPNKRFHPFKYEGWRLAVPISRRCYEELFLESEADTVVRIEKTEDID
jgi:hypothetical protein